MQRRWQLSPRPEIVGTHTPSRGRNGEIVTIGEETYIRWRNCLRKVSKGTGELLVSYQARKARLERIRLGAIVLCLIGAIGMAYVGLR